MSERNRAEGWQWAKLSGHKNEENVKDAIMTDLACRRDFLRRIRVDESDFCSVEIGGLNETDVASVLGGLTKNKPDLVVRCRCGRKINVSIKKSTGGQVYLITGEHFIHGFERQFHCAIPDAVKLGITLFFGQDYDCVFGTFAQMNVAPSPYERKKRRMTWQTMKNMGGKIKDAADAMLQWFKDNIREITLFCFSRGLAADSANWAQYVWYVNTVDADVNMDELFEVNDFANLMGNNVDEIFPGNTLGGTTLQLPFGFIQWHSPGDDAKRARAEERGEIYKAPGCLQFHHSFSKLCTLLN